MSERDEETLPFEIVVSAFGLDAAAAGALFDRVAEAAHALDEEVSCFGGPPTERLAAARLAVRAVLTRMEHRSVDHWHPNETGHGGVEGRAYYYAGDVIDDIYELRAAVAADPADPTHVIEFLSGDAVVRVNGGPAQAVRAGDTLTIPPGVQVTST